MASGQQLFAALEKNRNRECAFFHKKRFHNEASTATDYISVCLYKLYGVEILQRFDAYFQDLTKDTTQKNDQPYYNDELELNEALQDDIDLEWMLEEDKLSTRKQVKFYEQYDTSIASFKTMDHIKDSDKIDLTTNMDLES